MSIIRDKMKEQAEKNEQARKLQVEKLKDAFDSTATSEFGEKVLKEIYRRSGYGMPNRAINSTFQSLDVNGMILNEGRRSLWQEIRAFIPKKQLAKIEE